MRNFSLAVKGFIFYYTFKGDATHRGSGLHDTEPGTTLDTGQKDNEEQDTDRSGTGPQQGQRNRKKKSKKKRKKDQTQQDDTASPVSADSFNATSSEEGMQRGKPDDGKDYDMRTNDILSANVTVIHKYPSSEKLFLASEIGKTEQIDRVCGTERNEHICVEGQLLINDNVSREEATDQKDEATFVEEADSVVQKEASDHDDKTIEPDCANNDETRNRLNTNCPGNSAEEFPSPLFKETEAHNKPAKTNTTGKQKRNARDTDTTNDQVKLEKKYKPAGGDLMSYANSLDPDETPSNSANILPIIMQFCEMVKIKQTRLYACANFVTGKWLILSILYLYLLHNMHAPALVF